MSKQKIRMEKDSVLYQMFPKSMAADEEMQNIIACFEKANKDRGNKKVLSNEMLKCVGKYLFEDLHYSVEGYGDKKKVTIPVLYGENNSTEKAYDVDAINEKKNIIIEVEGGGGYQSRYFQKDIFEACLIDGVEFLVLAIPQEYYKKEEDEKPAEHYKLIKRELEMLYSSKRFILPLKGILLIGY